MRKCAVNGFKEEKGNGQMIGEKPVAVSQDWKESDMRLLEARAKENIWPVEKKKNLMWQG